MALVVVAANSAGSIVEEDVAPEDTEARDEFCARCGDLGIEADADDLVDMGREGVVENLAQREAAGRG